MAKEIFDGGSRFIDPAPYWLKGAAFGFAFGLAIGCAFGAIFTAVVLAR